MKKYLFGGALVSLAILTSACGNDASDEGEGEVDLNMSEEEMIVDLMDSGYTANDLLNMGYTKKEIAELLGETPTEIEQEEMDVETVIKEIDVNEVYDVSPFNVTIDNIAIKNVKNISDDLASDLEWAEYGYEYGDEDVNYISVSYTAENTSEEAHEFKGMERIAFQAGDSQEILDIWTDDIDFIRDDAHDENGGEYLGGSTLKGETGVVIKSNPKDINDFELTIGSSRIEIEEYLPEEVTPHQTATYSFE